MPQNHAEFAYSEYRTRFSWKGERGGSPPLPTSVLLHKAKKKTQLRPEVSKKSRDNLKN